MTTAVFWLLLLSSVAALTLAAVLDALWHRAKAERDQWRHLAIAATTTDAGEAIAAGERAVERANGVVR